jgi:hypothetical protein
VHRRNLRKRASTRAFESLLLKPSRFRYAVLGKDFRKSADAVLEFKKSGKPVYAYLEYGTDRDYYLATAADKVFLMPVEPLDLHQASATYELCPSRNPR